MAHIQSPHTKAEESRVQSHPQQHSEFETSPDLSHSRGGSGDKMAQELKTLCYLNLISHSRTQVGMEDEDRLYEVFLCLHIRVQ